jgi:hypothetical protein
MSIHMDLQTLSCSLTVYSWNVLPNSKKRMAPPLMPRLGPYNQKEGKKP